MIRISALIEPAIDGLPSEFQRLVAAKCRALAHGKDSEEYKAASRALDAWISGRNVALDKA